MSEAKICKHSRMLDAEPTLLRCADCGYYRPKEVKSPKPSSFKEEMNAYEHFLRTKTHLHYDDIDGFSYRAGAHWALCSQLVKDMAMALENTLVRLAMYESYSSPKENQVAMIAGKVALEAYKKEMAGE